MRPTRYAHFEGHTDLCYTNDGRFVVLENARKLFFHFALYFCFIFMFIMISVQVGVNGNYGIVLLNCKYLVHRRKYFKRGMGREGRRQKRTENREIRE